jgi:ABC-type Fe3+ transport system substrate-binding protein
MLKKAKNKNGARLFINWILSSEGQFMQYAKTFGPQRAAGNTLPGLSRDHHRQAPDHPRRRDARQRPAQEDAEGVEIPVDLARGQEKKA